MLLKSISCYLLPTTAGRDWGQEEKGTTEDEMAGWHHLLDRHEFGWTLGVGDGQGGMVRCNSWGRKESDTTEQLNWTELKKVPVIWTLTTSSLPFFVILLYYFPHWCTVFGNTGLAFPQANSISSPSKNFATALLLEMLFPYACTAFYLPCLSFTLHAVQITQCNFQPHPFPPPS